MIENGILKQRIAKLPNNHKVIVKKMLDEFGIMLRCARENNLVGFEQKYKPIMMQQVNKKINELEQKTSP